MIINSALWVLGRHLEKLDPIQKHAAIVTSLIFGLGHDNFISIRAVIFLKPVLRFQLLKVSSGFRSSYLQNHTSIPWKFECLSFLQTSCHHGKNAVDLEKYLWTRRLPQFLMLLLYRVIPKYPQNFWFHLCLKLGSSHL